MAKEGTPGPQLLGLKARRRLLRPGEPPVGTHHIAFSRVAGEIVMDVGFFDMTELVKQINAVSQSKPEERAKEIEVTVNVVAQYAMAADAFLRLRANVEQIYQAMLESGDLKGTAGILGDEE